LKRSGPVGFSFLITAQAIIYQRKAVGEMRAGITPYSRFQFAQASKVNLFFRIRLILAALNRLRRGQTQR
jgi:hypothetical protein